MRAPPNTPTTWRRQLGQRLAVLDALAIGLASVLAFWLRGAIGEAGLATEFLTDVPVALGVLPLWLLILYLVGAYRPEYINSGGDAFRRFTAGTIGGVFALGFVSFALNLEVSRLYVAFLFLFAFVLGGLVRVVVRRSLAARYGRGELTQPVLIVGPDTDGRELARAITVASGTGYRVVGYLDDGHSVGSVLDDIPVVGTTADVLTCADAHHVGLVIVSPSSLPPGTLQDITLALEGSPVDLAVAPSLFQVVTRRMTVESIGNVPILHVDQIRLQRGRAALKRTLDLAVASVMLVVAIPFLLAAAIMIKAEDRGPVFYRQTRVGRDGRQFSMWKLRTMVPDADERLEEVSHLNEVGDKFFKVIEDPRVTSIGRVLRRWSLDEVPQLWNVIIGDMSMVGPRPPLPSEVAEYTDWEMRRLRVRPGLTGVWQTSGRSNVPFDEAIRLDLFYIENWSLGYDLYLLLKTAGAVMRREGAY